MLESLVVGVVAFASTNVDDILLVALFFAQPRRRVAAITLGQYLGIGALVVASMAAAYAAVVVPSTWIPWLGIAPCALGVKLLLAADVDEATPDVPRDMGVLAVAAVTVANGADNLGVYIPMFASRPDALPIYLAVFAVGTAVWCGLGYWVVSHRTAGAVLARYGQRLLPWALIGIGLYVLSDLIV